MPLIQQRLVIKQVELRRRARHEQVDDALGLRREVRLSRRERLGGKRLRRLRLPFARLGVARVQFGEYADNLVERSPGDKDPIKIKEFVARARASME